SGTIDRSSSSARALPRTAKVSRLAPPIPGGATSVTVHASRTTRGQRIHEETQMVSVREKGGVVRMSAYVPLGEPIVLTNNESGAEVLCRVRKIIPFAGNQSDVELEFAQPALGFWAKPALTDAPASPSGAPCVGDCVPVSSDASSASTNVQPTSGRSLAL